jgi:hypothetical protein
MLEDCEQFDEYFDFMKVRNFNVLTLSDSMSDLVRHYDFPVPDAFLEI